MLFALDSLITNILYYEVKVHVEYQVINLQIKSYTDKI